MEPFSRVNNHKSLTSALNDTFEMFRWLNEHSLNDRDQATNEEAANNDIPGSNNQINNNNNNRQNNQIDPNSSANSNELINEDYFPLESPLEFDNNNNNSNNVDQQSLHANNNCSNMNHQNKNNHVFDDDTKNQQQQQQQHHEQDYQQTTNGPDAIIMDKRQLIDALTSTFLGKLKSSLVERVQEFTDCAYTKHENREIILQLVQCLKLQLNKLVKLLYKLVSLSFYPKNISLNNTFCYTNYFH